MDLSQILRYLHIGFLHRGIPWLSPFPCGTSKWQMNLRQVWSARCLKPALQVTHCWSWLDSKAPQIVVAGYSYHESILDETTIFVGMVGYNVSSAQCCSKKHFKLNCRLPWYNCTVILLGDAQLFGICQRRIGLMGNLEEILGLINLDMQPWIS